MKSATAPAEESGAAVPGPGSILIKRGNAVLGAVGVSGGKPEQDVDCAEAGLKAL